MTNRRNKEKHHRFNIGIIIGVVSFAFTTFIQIGALVWWLAKLDSKVEHLEALTLKQSEIIAQQSSHIVDMNNKLIRQESVQTQIQIDTKIIKKKLMNN